MEDVFGRLEKFDVEEGLKRIGGSEDLLVELLDSFVRDFSHTQEEYKQFAEDKDWDSARRLIHSVKGAAGNLGAGQLRNSASLLEEALKRDDPVGAQEQWPRFNCALDEAVADIQQSGIPDVLSACQSKNDTDKESLIKLLREFRVQADLRKIPSAREKYREIRMFVWPEEAEVPLDKIGVCVKKYDFKGAASLTEQLVAELIRTES
ncbi:MAG: Hpt domain-containing protein [Spirochaetales bacterium]|nr:Hpt domain-containing protein [Spirochaetales bacterium]